MRSKPLAATKRTGSKPNSLRWFTTVALVAKGILRQRFAQALEHAVVVHDHAAVLAGIDAVGAGNGLHERVRLHRLVNVAGGEGPHVKGREPHKAHKWPAERGPG